MRRLRARVMPLRSVISPRMPGSRTVTVQAGIREGVQADAIYARITTELEAAGLDKLGIRWKLAGEDEEQAESMARALGVVTLAGDAPMEPPTLPSTGRLGFPKAASRASSSRRIDRPKERDDIRVNAGSLVYRQSPSYQVLSINLALSSHLESS